MIDIMINKSVHESKNNERTIIMDSFLYNIFCNNIRNEKDILNLKVDFRLFAMVRI